MTRSLSLIGAVAVASVFAAGCGFEHSTNVLVPTSINGSSKSAAGGNGSTNTSTNTATSTAPSLLGSWVSPVLPPGASSTTCGNFTFQLASQTASTVSGNFTGECGGGVAMTGSVNAQVNGTVVVISATGTAAGPGVPNCSFSFTGTGALEDNGNTLRAPFTGTTCLGPVSGVEVLRRPQKEESISFTDPTPVSPGPNVHLSNLHPQFTVSNATHTGTVGAVSYVLEVGNDEAFTSIFAAATSVEQPNQTSITLSRDLEYTHVYYWHVRATDPTKNGPWSRTLALQVMDPPPPPPPPPTSSGQDAIDLRQASIVGGSPSDVAYWPVTTRIQALDFQASGAAVQFSKKDGGGRWPDVVPPGWDGALQYTLWMVVNVNGHWYTSGGVEYWYGLGRHGGQPSRFASNWYYSPAVWGPLAGHQPSVGEQVGFFVTAGDARAKDVRSVIERSNVVLVPFPSDGGAYYPF